LAAGKQPAMSGNHLIVAIDQEWDIKTKARNTVGDLLNLLFVMTPRIGGVGL